MKWRFRFCGFASLVHHATRVASDSTTALRWNEAIWYLCNKNCEGDSTNHPSASMTPRRCGPTACSLTFFPDIPVRCRDANKKLISMCLPYSYWLFSWLATELRNRSEYSRHGLWCKGTYVYSSASEQYIFEILPWSLTCSATCPSVLNKLIRNHAQYRSVPGLIFPSFTVEPDLII